MENNNMKLDFPLFYHSLNKYKYSKHSQSSLRERMEGGVSLMTVNFSVILSQMQCAYTGFVGIE